MANQTMGTKFKLTLEDLQMIEGIVEKQVDRIVAQKITALRTPPGSLRLRRRGGAGAWNSDDPPVPPTLDGEAFCHNSAELARALGLPRDDIRVIRLYARNDPGPSPFQGWGAYPSTVRRWLQERSTVPALSRMLRRLGPVNRTKASPAGPA